MLVDSEIQRYFAPGQNSALFTMKFCRFCQQLYRAGSRLAQGAGSAIRNEFRLC